LTAKSNLTVPVEIYSVTSHDSRIETRILNHDIKPWNLSISAMVTFDPGMTGTETNSEFIRQIS